MFYEKQELMMGQKRDPLVLIADDVSFVRQKLALVLKSRGYRVCEAENGEEAVRQAQTMRPDVILLDVMMPVMDGFEAAECIRADDVLQDVPIIFLTARNTADDVRHAMKCDADSYLTKPAHPDRVIEQIGQVAAAG